MMRRLCCLSAPFWCNYMYSGGDADRSLIYQVKTYQINSYFCNRVVFYISRALSLLFLTWMRLGFRYIIDGSCPARRENCGLRYIIRFTAEEATLVRCLLPSGMCILKEVAGVYGKAAGWPSSTAHLTQP